MKKLHLQKSNFWGAVQKDAFLFLCVIASLKHLKIILSVFKTNFYR